MRIETHFGRSGLVALLSFFCLSTASILSQAVVDSDAPSSGPTEESPLSLPSMAEMRRLQEQYQSAFAAIEALRQEMQSEFERRSTSISAQLTLIEQGLATQHEQDLLEVYRSNQTTLTVVLVMIGILGLGVLFIALVPLRLMNRLAARVAAYPAASGVAGLEGDHTTFTPPEAISARLQSSLQSLEQRLAELEARSMHPYSARPSAPYGASVKLADQRPATKAPSTSRVSLAVGGGEALMFLPREGHAPKLRSPLNLLQRIRKTFIGSPSAKPGSAKIG